MSDRTSNPVHELTRLIRLYVASDKVKALMLAELEKLRGAVETAESIPASDVAAPLTRQQVHLAMMEGIDAATKAWNKAWKRAETGVETKAVDVDGVR